MYLQGDVLTLVLSQSDSVQLLRDGTFLVKGRAIAVSAARWKFSLRISGLDVKLKVQDIKSALSAAYGIECQDVVLGSSTIEDEEKEEKEEEEGRRKEEGRKKEGR